MTRRRPSIQEILANGPDPRPFDLQMRESQGYRVPSIAEWIAARFAEELIARELGGYVRATRSPIRLAPRLVRRPSRAQ